MFGRSPVSLENIPYLYFAFIALWGACTGSFLNVVIYRLPRGMSLLTPPSRCLNCEDDVGVLDVTPVAAWFWLGGKCRRCGASIPLRYPVVELLTALLCGAVAYVNAYNDYGVWVDVAVLVAQLLFAASLVAVVFIDLDHRIIPDAITLPGLAAALALSAAFPQLHLLRGATPASGLFAALAGLAAGGGVMLLLRWSSLLLARHLVEKAQGTDPELDAGVCLGDAKLLAYAGAFLGWREALLAAGLSLLVGSLHGLSTNFATGRWPRAEEPEHAAGLAARLWFRWNSGQLAFAFGPALAISCLLVLLLRARLLAAAAWLFSA